MCSQILSQKEIKNLENKLVKAKNMMENEEKKYKDYQKDEENLYDEKREISISEDEIEKFNEIEKELTKKIDLLNKKIVIIYFHKKTTL